jgi:hypothetical protein
MCPSSIHRHQALGACSGQVISRAIVRDLFEPREARASAAVCTRSLFCVVCRGSGQWNIDAGCCPDGALRGVGLCHLLVSGDAKPAAPGAFGAAFCIAADARSSCASMARFSI